MQIIRSLGINSHLLYDFYYAFSEKKSNMNDCINSYFFESIVLNNLGWKAFESFGGEICKEAFIFDMGNSITNFLKVNLIEIIPDRTSFKFHFDNDTVFECEAPYGLKDSLKFGALSQIVMNSFSEVEKFRSETAISNNITTPPLQSSLSEFH